MNRKLRSSNFSSEEKALLVSLIEDCKTVIENKATDSKTNHEKDKCWLKITDIFTSCGHSRTTESLKKLWGNLKRKSRKLSGVEKGEILKPGSGTVSLPSESLLEKVLDIIPKPVKGVDHNDFDFEKDTAYVVCSSVLSNSAVENVTIEGTQSELESWCTEISSIPTKESTLPGVSGTKTTPGMGIPLPDVSGAETPTVKSIPFAQRWKNRRRAVMRKTGTKTEKLMNLKIELALLGKEQAIEEFRLKKELLELKIIHEKQLMVEELKFKKEWYAIKLEHEKLALELLKKKS